MKSINTTKTKTRRIVSGALYDFCAHITSLKTPILVGDNEDPLELLDILAEWSLDRGLNLNDNPDIHKWNVKV